MNEARKKVEAFKKNANHDQLKGIAWNITVDKKGLDYHQHQRAVSVAIDNAIAEQLGVTLTDHSEWPDESAKQQAKDWVASLPDA